MQSDHREMCLESLESDCHSLHCPSFGADNLKSETRAAESHFRISTTMSSDLLAHPFVIQGRLAAHRQLLVPCSSRTMSLYLTHFQYL